MELFLVECFRGSLKDDEEDLVELKLIAWSVLMCFFNVTEVLDANSHDLQENVDPLLYLTLDLLTLLGPIVSRTALLKATISPLCRAALLSK